MTVSNLDYALMAGAAYYSTRDINNRIPYPDGWDLLDGGWIGQFRIAAVVLKLLLSNAVTSKAESK